MGPRYLEDVLETMGAHVDALKFAGGSFTLMPERALREIIELAHDHDVAGLDRRLHRARAHASGATAVDRYIEECRELGFDIVEISAGFITHPDRRHPAAGRAGPARPA